jgi:Phage integrase, N-terminal SAM-like domain
MRRKRFQTGSLFARKHGRHRVWVAFWREDGVRRCKTLGHQSEMSKGQAEAALSDLLREVNAKAQAGKPVYTFEQFVERVYLPFCRRTWKESTESVSEQIIKAHLTPQLGSMLLQDIGREQLQDLLDRKAEDRSKSTVAHCRWFLNAIFKLALSDGFIATIRQRRCGFRKSANQGARCVRLQERRSCST